MAETLVDFFINAFSADMSREVLVFIISLFPILELRGGILAGYALNMELLPSFVIEYLLAFLFPITISPTLNF